MCPGNSACCLEEGRNCHRRWEAVGCTLALGAEKPAAVLDIVAGIPAGEAPEEEDIVGSPAAGMNWHPYSERCSSRRLGLDAPWLRCVSFS